MKLDSHLPQLPSIGELLEHPRVKVLVARINRSTLAQRAAGFLDELRGSLASRANDATSPSLGQLAERLARRVLGEPMPHGPVINATGLVFGDAEIAPPLAERCLHAMFQLTAEYHRRAAPVQRPAALRELGEALGGEAAFVASSFDAALTITLAAAAGGRDFVVCGKQSPAPDPIDWGRIAARSGATLRTAAQPQDAPQGVAAIVRAPGAEDELDASLPALTAIASLREACLIDVAPAAGTIDPAAHGFTSVPTIRERLAAGADLVVADGAGLLGGPACGLIVGRRKFVDQAASHPLASLAAVDPLTAAALNATLELYRDAEKGPVILQVPVWQQLSAPLDNLKQRAERLAPLMAESQAVASAESRQVDSVWRRWGDRQWMAPSWVIVLRPAAEDCRALQAQLQRGPYPVLARECDGALHLDLRTVFPRWDQQLVAAVTET